MTQAFTRDELKAARQLAHLTQRQLASLAGVSPGFIGSLESSKVPDRVVAALNDALSNRLNAA